MRAFRAHSRRKRTWIGSIFPRELFRGMLSNKSVEDAHRFKVIPIASGETGLVVAISDPLDIDTIDSLSFLSLRLPQRQQLLELEIRLETRTDIQR